MKTRALLMAIAVTVLVVWGWCAIQFDQLDDRGATDAEAVPAGPASAAGASQQTTPPAVVLTAHDAPEDGEMFGWHRHGPALPGTTSQTGLPALHAETPVGVASPLFRAPSADPPAARLEPPLGHVASTQIRNDLAHRSSSTMPQIIRPSESGESTASGNTWAAGGPEAAASAGALRRLPSVSDSSTASDPGVRRLPTIEVLDIPVHKGVHKGVVRLPPVDEESESPPSWASPASPSEAPPLVASDSPSVVPPTEPGRSLDTFSPWSSPALAETRDPAEEEEAVPEAPVGDSTSDPLAENDPSWPTTTELATPSVSVESPVMDGPNVPDAANDPFANGFPVIPASPKVPDADRSTNDPLMGQGGGEPTPWAASAEDETFENKTFENKTFENKTFENKTFENKTFENKTFENKTFENKTFEDKTFEDKTFEDKTAEDKTAEDAFLPKIDGVAEPSASSPLDAQPTEDERPWVESPSASAPSTSEPALPSCVTNSTRPAIPLTSAQAQRAMHAVRPRVQGRLSQGINLADRRAFYSARTQFVSALRLLAQSLDAQAGTTQRGQALDRGLWAIEEADDFIPRDDGLDAGPNVQQLIAVHRTTAGKSQAGRTTPLAAIQVYYTYAQEQLADAVKPATQGSQALSALGKLYVEIDKEPSHLVADPRTKGLVVQQAALLVDPNNAQAANELGVLLAREGRYAEARDWLRHSATLLPQRETWHNLAVVHTHLGEKHLAEAARQQSLAVAQRDARGRLLPVGSTQRPQVQRVTPEEFAGVTARPNVDSQSAQPNPRAAGRSSQPSSGIWSWLNKPWR